MRRRALSPEMVSFIQSDNICAATEDVLERAAACAGTCPVFIIVPDRFTLQAERILLQKKSCLFNVRVVTFSMLYVILSEELDSKSPQPEGLKQSRFHYIKH